MNFRKLLLNRCQKEFEKDKDDDEVFEKKQKELDAATMVIAQICIKTLQFCRIYIFNTLTVAFKAKVRFCFIPAARREDASK